MDKKYNHKEVEKGIDAKWQKNKYFQSHDETKRPFTILLPPPNVTGKLHLGHALDVYIPDTIIRYKKLQGYDVLWLPGMDHAGIATQSKVEDEIYKASKLTRHDLGREKFLDKVWEWKEEYAKLFKKQWSTIGLALDYSNERFTLDAQANQAVLKVFVDLYNKGFIYKGVKAINWDVKLQTAVSNIEVNNEPTNQKMYYIKYPVVNSNQFLVVATVRTETLLSDVAIVFNPNDQRYKHLIGQSVIHPLTNKIIPIISDEYVDPEFGSGLMKLSAHAEADIEIIQKLGLEINETIDKNGFINCPESQFHGLERFDARNQIGQYLLDNGFIEKIDEVVSNVGISDRSKTPVEILVLPQWFVKMEHFRDLILNNLDSQQGVKFFPKRFENTMRQWMEDVHDWTISRQLWWGHRIPAWYKDNEVKVQIDCPGLDWVQDSDVLDTWFSSGLAPFVFLGWPQSNQKLNRYYPTSLLVTGYDIIFFWVARMYFFGLEFQGQKPFNELLLHGLIRDAQGRKMSKSLNNGVDPMEVIDQYGSDALRWFLITNTTPGLDIRFSTEKVESAWKVNNKLWNIAKYIKDLPDNNVPATDADLWIMQALSKLNNKINSLMQTYDFSVIGTEIYRYIFNDLSSWYVEFLKSSYSKQAAMNVLKQTLIILHPFMPFLTDKLFSDIFNQELLEQSWPEFEVYQSESYISTVIAVVAQLRKYREDNKLSHKQALYYCLDKEINQIALETINKMANASVVENRDFLVALDAVNLYIQESAELKQQNKLLLEAKIKHVQSEIARAQGILANANFVSKAPAEKVQAEKDKLNKYQEELNQYQEEWKCKNY
ncbi:valine--tRNA ligase [Mycoplasma nasistruthionis]|uniref:Valine--tRNA ligase n=1 Tax=Mycoplasma nasistruthionis TaxID=353852 RepID=A0A5B7XVD3_9MOLU|nr:valine--tRNA ligase [Mycoplasma nasistruthionis]QCZ36490.1 valine--tRNA ligase [Mycoplasma nasistruthionis]